MKRFRKILFINDPPNGTAAVKRAVQLAHNNQAQLTIASISEELPPKLEKYAPALQRLQEEELRTLVEGFQSQTSSLQILQLSGTPFIEIIKEVVRNGHDLVIKPAEGRSSLSSTLFGSTDLHLLRKCPCPVWIIKPTKKKKYARILAAVDPNPGEPTNSELNNTILELSSSLAMQEKSELHIVHAWSMIFEAKLRSGRAHVPMTEIERLTMDTHKAHKKWLQALLAEHDLSGVSHKVHLSKGDAGLVIPSLAQKKRVQLIVMGTVARTGIPGFFIGNTAEKILAAVDCAVLAVKPRAFQTPVQI